MVETLKSQIVRKVDELPETSLVEVMTFLEYLQFRQDLMPRKGERYQPVAIGGLWATAHTAVDDLDLDMLRQEMWGKFGN